MPKGIDMVVGGGGSAPFPTPFVMNTKQLLTPALLLAATPLAAAQIVYGTDDVTLDDNHYFNTSSGTNTSALWADGEVWGLADDDVGGVMYIGDGSALLAWPYNDPNPATAVGTFNDAGRTLVPLGLGYNNGMLLGYDNDALGLEGFWDVDVVTGDCTLFFAVASTAGDFGGVDIDPATGLIYCSNDAGGYVDTSGTSGNGVVAVDAVMATETIVAPYPAGVIDIDGLALDPAGVLWMLEDNPAPLHNYNLGTMMFDPAPPMNAITTTEVFSGGTYTTGFSPSGSGLGTNYCMAAANSTGVPASMSASGSLAVADNDVTLTASDLPPNQFGIFVTSMTQAFVPGAGGTSNGNICLGGIIGRYQLPSQILSSGATGEFSLTINLPTMPQGSGSVAVMNGDTWNFQAWYRDGVGLGSNFTDGLQIDFN